jgi:hypothetical protein
LFTLTTSELKQFKVFVDWKSQVKRKSRLLDLDKNKTGGGQAEAKPLSDLEERLIGLIGKVVVSGTPDLPEAGVVMEMPDPKSPPELVPLPVFTEDNIELTNVKLSTSVAPKGDELSSNNSGLKKPLKKVDPSGSNLNH